MNVSIIVPSRNRAVQLANLMQRLEAQQTEHAWEVIVVLDGPDDESASVLTDWERVLPLRVIGLRRSVGASGALNAGADAATGDVLIRCDDDLLPPTWFIERHASWHVEQETVGVIGLTRNVFPPASCYGEVYGRHADALLRSAAYACAPAERWRHWAANTSVHRSMWERVGPYNEAFRRGEDSEWGYRFQLAGGSLVIDPELETEHTRPAPSASARAAMSFLSGAARAHFASVHGRLPQPPSSTRVSRADPWSALVAAAAVGRSQTYYRQLGGMVDRLIPLLPVAVARKLVALSIEAAGVAGQRGGYPPRL